MSSLTQLFAKDDERVPVPTLEEALPSFAAAKQKLVDLQLQFAGIQTEVDQALSGINNDSSKSRRDVAAQNYLEKGSLRH